MVCFLVLEYMEKRRSEISVETSFLSLCKQNHLALKTTVSAECNPGGFLPILESYDIPKSKKYV